MPGVNLKNPRRLSVIFVLSLLVALISWRFSTIRSGYVLEVTVIGNPSGARFFLGEEPIAIPESSPTVVPPETLHSFAGNPMSPAIEIARQVLGGQVDLLRHVGESYGAGCIAHGLVLERENGTVDSLVLLLFKESGMKRVVSLRGYDQRPQVNRLSMTIGEKIDPGLFRKFWGAQAKVSTTVFVDLSSEDFEHRKWWIDKKL